MRRVVMLCGPPGAGKTTAARTSGLTVYDRDDDHWTGEAHFRSALRRLARDRAARAVVIRSGATSNARAAAAELMGATHTFLLVEDAAVLRDRIRRRHRADMVATLIAVDTWLTRFDRRDGCPPFAGWAALDAPADAPGATSTDW